MDETPEELIHEMKTQERRRLAQQIGERREQRESDEFRSKLADVIKPTALAASVTPYDAGLGDLAYAAGELIDPEGDPEMAALAAGVGLSTGGVGSGALAARMAKIPRKTPKKVFGTFKGEVSLEQHLKDALRKGDLLDKHPSLKDRIKNMDLNAPLPPDLPPTVRDKIKRVIQDYVGKLPAATAQTLGHTARAQAYDGPENRPLRDTIMDMVRTEMAGEQYSAPPGTPAHDMTMPFGWSFRKPEGFDDLTQDKKDAYFKARRERMQKLGERMKERRDDYRDEPSEEVVESVKPNTGAGSGRRF